MAARIMLRAWLLESVLQFTSQTGIYKSVKRNSLCRRLIILTKGETIAEAENYINFELRKISDWAQNNKLMFNEHTSKVMLLSRRKRKEKRM